MERLVVDELNIGKNIIPCMWILRVIYEKDVHNHLIDDLYLVINLRVEASGFSDIIEKIILVDTIFVYGFHIPLNSSCRLLATLFFFSFLAFFV